MAVEPPQSQGATREPRSAAEREPTRRQRARRGPASALVSRSSRSALASFTEQPGGARQRTAATTHYLVDDGTTALGPGQMEKRAFLAELRARVHAGVEEELEGTPYQADGCPWIRVYFRYYEKRTATRVEEDLRRYVPALGRARSALHYLAPAVEHVRRSVRVWRHTGRIPDVPTRLPGMGQMGLGSVLLSEQRGGGRPEIGAALSAGSLGRGQALPSRVRGPMEGALRTRLDQVRVHTGTQAAGWSGSMHADAFAAGNHVAFAPGRYRPGSPAGDALLAHELAHVSQASETSGEAPVLRAGEPASAAAPLERDANRAAAGALASLYGLEPLVPGLQHGTRRRTRGSAVPRLESCEFRDCSVANPRELATEQQARVGQARAAHDTRFNALLDDQRIGPERMSRLIDAQVGIATDLQLTYEALERWYLAQAQQERGNRLRLIELQREFRSNVDNLMSTFRRQADLTVRWGIVFRNGMNTTRRDYDRRSVWTLAQLNRVDRLLARIPPAYLTRIRTIRRVPGLTQAERRFGGRTTGAYWSERDGSISLTDEAFGSDFERMFLHEVGHGTVVERSAGGFHKLPPADWMATVDWRLARRSTLASDLGIEASAAAPLLARLDASHARGVPTPERAGTRTVVWDIYEPRTEEASAPTQFVHFDRARAGEFAPHARAKEHPAEDLAESFAYYLMSRDDARRIFDVGGAQRRDKWDYLTQHHPEPLGEAP